MRQEKQQFRGQRINPGGLIGAHACFKGPCCTHLSVPECMKSVADRLAGSETLWDMPQVINTL